jgi:hypothetical protein
MRISLQSLLSLFFVFFLISSCEKKSTDDSTEDDKKSTESDDDDDDDDDDDNGTSSAGTITLGMTENTAAATPSISALTQAQIDSVEDSDTLMPGTIAVESQSSLVTTADSYSVGDKFTPTPIINLFQYQCHESYEPSGENFCPDDLILPEKYEDSFYGFQDSLLAKIRFAERYLGNVYKFIPPGVDCKTIECGTCDTCYELGPKKCSSGDMDDYLSSECLPSNRCLVQNKCATCNACENGGGTLYNPVDVTDDKYEYVAVDGSSDGGKYIVDVKGVYDVISEPGDNTPDAGRYSISIKQTI